MSGFEKTPDEMNEIYKKVLSDTLDSMTLSKLASAYTQILPVFVKAIKAEGFKDNMVSAQITIAFFALMSANLDMAEVIDDDPDRCAKFLAEKLYDFAIHQITFLEANRFDPSASPFKVVNPGAKVVNPGTGTLQ